MKNRLVRRSPPSPAEMLSSSATGSKFLTRRSPRFSSTRPVELNAAAADVSDALALSLHVIGVGNGEEPVPLQIFVPTTLSAEKSMPKCRRRSPRFTTNKYSSASTRSLDVKALSVTVENGGGKLDGACRGIAMECSNSWGKRRHCEVTSEGEILKESRKVRKCLATCNGGVLDNLEEKCLRRSPRLNVKCKLLALPEPSLMEEKKIDLTLSEKTLRSRKIVSQRVLEKENKKSDNGNVKSELLAVPEPPPSVEKKNNDLTMSERTLRSRKIEFRLIQEEEIEVKTASIETSFENGINLGSCDSGQSSENCLLSRKILASLVSRSSKAPLTQSKGCALSEKKQKKQKVRSCFVGEQVPEDEAQERWRL